MQAAIQNVIHVERDADGIEHAARELFEESFLRGKYIAPLIASGEHDAAARLVEDLPVRELSPGYYLRAQYLLDLALSIDLRVQFPAGSLLRTDVTGLAAIRNARNGFETDHPPCGACGKRQMMPGLKQCEDCGTKFRGER